MDKEKIPKTTLKDALFDDENEILIKLATTDDVNEKELYNYTYQLVKKYINICKDRKRF